jgi:hypothetical protein
VKVLPSQREIVRCNSSGPLYPLHLPPAHSLVAQASSPLWHRRLGHPGHEAFSKLASSVSCPIQDCSELCHACQLGRHVRLPFHSTGLRHSPPPLLSLTFCPPRLLTFPHPTLPFSASDVLTVTFESLAANVIPTHQLLHPTNSPLCLPRLLRSLQRVPLP